MTGSLDDDAAVTVTVEVTLVPIEKIRVEVVVTSTLLVSALGLCAANCAYAPAVAAAPATMPTKIPSRAILSETDLPCLNCLCAESELT